MKLIGLIDAGEPDKAEKFWRAHMEAAGKTMQWGSLATDTVIDLFI